MEIRYQAASVNPSYGVVRCSPRTVTTPEMCAVAGWLLSLLPPGDLLIPVPPKLFTPTLHNKPRFERPELVTPLLFFIFLSCLLKARLAYVKSAVNLHQSISKASGCRGNEDEEFRGVLLPHTSIRSQEISPVIISSLSAQCGMAPESRPLVLYFVASQMTALSLTEGGTRPPSR